MFIAAVALARLAFPLTALSIAAVGVSFALVASVHAAERTAQSVGDASDPPPQNREARRRSDTFYESLARMVNDEPVQSRDLVAIGQLRSIGIEKGKPFNPDAATRAILKKAIKEAQAGFIRTNASLPPYYRGSQWSLPIGDFGHETGFTFQNAEHFALDERAAFFFLGCAPPVKGGASFYLFGQRCGRRAA